MFMPGPVEVFPRIREHLSRPIVGHRTEDFSRLYGEIIEMAAEFFNTKKRLYIGACTATGIMEAAVRNCVGKRCLCVVNGAFGERWYKIALSCGKKARALEFDWGKAADPKALAEALDRDGYDAVTIVHCESSTGVANPLEELKEAASANENTLVLVDAVSSSGGMPIDVSGVDVLVMGAQKAFAIPPGITPFFISRRALDRSSTVENRGYYFDFKQFEKHYGHRQPPYTTSIPHFYALHAQLEAMLDEGAERRYRRHAEMADKVRLWAEERFGIFAEKGFRSDTLTCVTNTRELDFGRLAGKLLNRGYVIADGYGRLAGETFRIGHMGDWRPGDIDGLLTAIDRAAAEM